MTSIALAAAAVAVTWLIDGIDAASRALGRRDDLNFPVSPSPAGGGGSVARTLIPGVLDVSSQNLSRSAP